MTTEQTPAKDTRDFYRVEVAARGNKPAYTFYTHDPSPEAAEHWIRCIWLNGQDMEDGFWTVESQDEPPAESEIKAHKLTTYGGVVAAFDSMNEQDEPYDHKHVWRALLKHCKGQDLLCGIMWVLNNEFWEYRGNYLEESPLFQMRDALEFMPPEIAALAHPRMFPVWQPSIKYESRGRALTGGEYVWSHDLDECVSDELLLLVGDHTDGFSVIAIEQFSSPLSPLMIDLSELEGLL